MTAATFAATFEARGLTCIRGERVVFENLAFSVAPGGALLLRGANGTGKSSLLRICAGFLQPAAGELRWNAAPVAGDIDAHRARLAYVGHLDALKPAFTVAENVAFWLRLTSSGASPLPPHPALPQGMGEGSKQALPQPSGEGGMGEPTGSALAALGLGHLASLPAAYLSAGQRRRLNLARLAGSAAPLWLLDEPTSSLDDASTHALLTLIEAHRAGGGMAVIATHQDLPLTKAEKLRIGAP